MTTTIARIALEAEDADAAQAFYMTLGVSDRVEVRAGDASTSGFRGYTLSLVVGQPANVDAFIGLATDAGAELVKEPTKSLWGYGGSFRAPDGAVWTVATSSKKNSGAAQAHYDDVVLLLGVEDVKASKRHYTDHGLTVARGFGSKYVEFDTAGVKLALQSRRAVAKNAGVDPAGSGSHRITIIGNVGPFTDPDGYVWEVRPDGAEER